MLTVGFVLLLMISVIAAIAYYNILLHDTDTLITDFQHVILENMSEDVDYGALEWYDRYNRENAKDIYINLKRKWVCHNFNKGIVFVKYNIELYDELGDCIRGAWNVDSEWCIEKKNGRWIVTEIHEMP